MPYFNIVAATTENTVVTEYKPAEVRADAYQSEAALEAEFIRLLTQQGYEDKPIHCEAELISNLRAQLEMLNNYRFSDSEWERFFSECIANANDGIAEKTRKIQEDNVQVLRRDDGSTKNITLIDKKNIHNNRLQVTNQYIVTKDDGAKHDNRYDVTVLVNGFPLVHIELKRRGVSIREAFNQIDRYQRDSFYAGSGLFEYVQIFVISNGTNTKYYSNSTRFNAVRDARAASGKKGKTSNSFEFTSYWADANNRIIPDLIDFAKTFFARHTILNILTRYCVFTSENLLLVMRPYQITATERILNRIEIANNYKKFGSIAGGGYIWHTTGSGKTLTSFKTARLASALPYIDKVLFVVDRKDLDYQTMKEYDRFEKGAANSNTSTAILKKQLEDENCHIIITTIQKLATFIKKNPGHAVYQKHVVIIFDECHRSQFGDMHTAIVKNFRKYHLFGFTGTPIFSVNAQKAPTSQFFTTEQTFGDQLHTYTIVDAINDHNVLPFRVDYVKTMDVDEQMVDEDVYDIDRERAYMAPKRIELVTKYILDHFDQKTYRGDKTYIYNTLTNISEVASAARGAVEEIKQKQRISGFNSMLAVASVPMARLYYNEFKRQMSADPTKKLRIATIFSYTTNEADHDSDLLDEENPEDTSALDASSRDFLDSAIRDYNEMFRTNYSTDGDGFQSYYYSADLSEKVLRGHTENALKCKYNGGTMPIGYYADKEQHYVADSLTAPFVLEAFRHYDEGLTMSEIAAVLNQHGLKNKRGGDIDIDSVSRMLSNRKYIGEYRYRDIVIPNGIPALVPQDLFDRVQEKIAKNKKAPARHKAEDDYLLTTKLFCGECESLMVGECGTSRSGAVHHYYKCTNAKRHGGCRKKAIKKDWIENLVVLEIRKKLEDARFIDDIVHAFMKFQTAENTVIPHLKQSLAELNKSIDNILAAIEQGIFTQSTKQRLEELESKKKDIEIEIAKESIRRPLLNEDQVRFWFERLRNLNINELSHRKRLIDTFLNSVFVYDDKLLINCNYPNTSTIVRFSDINATLNGSDILACGRPKQRSS